MTYKVKPVPVLSIVIPTRNRTQYLISAIKSILIIPDSGLELVIHDTSDTRDLESLLAETFSDSRLRYFYTDPPVSFSETFSKAVNFSTGEYICIIGDDDGVNPEIMQAVLWAKENDLDALRPNLVANYFWPDLQVHTGLIKHAGKLFILNFTGDITYPVADTEARKCIHNAGLSYLDTNLPKIYHGVIKRKCLDKIKNISGEYFKGLSPDIFGALAVSNFVNRMCTIDYPLTISGTSFYSGAGDSAAGKHKGRLEDAPHLKGRNDYLWDNLIPRFYSIQTIWAESAVVALRETKRLDLLDEFNLPLLYAQCAIFHPNFISTSIPNMFRAFKIMNKNYFISTSIFLYYFVAIITTRAIKSVIYRIRVRFSKTILEIDGVNSIEEAMNSLTNYLADNNLKFNELKDVRVVKSQRYHTDSK